MLALLEARLGNEPKVELSIASAEQAKITRLRIEKLLKT
jgi:2-oxo-4-hydroxy-4-carboxy-5-ureidoimidazoline decarboxylase